MCQNVGVAIYMNNSNNNCNFIRLLKQKYFSSTYLLLMRF